MSDIWFTSDSHFGHSRFLTFTNDLGEPIRPFASVEEMDETMIERWNEVVKPGDKVYHLGDFAIGRDVKQYVTRLNGRKRLILGNHDDIKKQNLVACFEKILVWRVFKDEGFVCTHVPIMEENFCKLKMNVHGHIHDRVAVDEVHLNVCVEQTDYRPIHLDEIVQEIADRGL